MWRSLPKNRHGRVEWRLLRYVTHRHFMQRFNVLVRGLEPTIRVNASHSGEAEILSEQAPMLAQQLTGPQAERGFSLEEAVAMIAALEQMLFGSDSALLEKVYRGRRFATNKLVDKSQLQALLKDYIVHWIVNNDEDAAFLLKNPKILLESIPHWDAIKAMVDGSVEALDFSRQQMPEASTVHTVFAGSHTFEDALEVVGSIARNFGSFWETQCQDTKVSLLSMDTTGTGRIRLPDFYGANKDGEWRFGESEAYLRELGALDETSPWRGKQVIVSNYMQAASNCVITRPHYLVCCMIECEEIMGQLEAAVGAPMAAPDMVLEVVRSMTDGDDDPVRVDNASEAQLLRVAQTHGGRVPLHGRLFAQWLHYVFPRECPFPHKAGGASALTPAQFGEDAIATPEAVNKHVAEDIVHQDLAGGNTTSEPGLWMSQWSEEEELLVDYSFHSSMSLNGNHVLTAGVAAASVVGLLVIGSKKASDCAPRTHSV